VIGPRLALVLSSTTGDAVQAKSWIRIGLSVAMGLAILYRIPVHSLESAARGINFSWLGAALVCTGGMLAARSYRWHRLLGAGGVGSTRTDTARSLLAGFTLSLVTPGRVGELGRCLFVKEESRARVLMLTLLDRGLDSWALASCGVLSLMALKARPYGIFALGVWLTMLPVVMGMPTLLAHLASVRWWPASLRVGLSEAARCVKGISTPTFASWALVSTSFDMLTFFCLLRAFQRVSLMAAVIAFPWIIMAGGLPISISGIGPREGVAAMILAQFAFPSAAAIDVGLLLWAVTAVLPAFAGGIWLVASGAALPRLSWSATYANTGANDAA